LEQRIPYLVGSGGTVLSTLPILVQFYQYKDKLGKGPYFNADGETTYIEDLSGDPDA